LEESHQVSSHRVILVLMAKEFLLGSIPNQNSPFQPELQSEVCFLVWLVVQDLEETHIKYFFIGNHKRNPP